VAKEQAAPASEFHPVTPRWSPVVQLSVLAAAAAVVRFGLATRVQTPVYLPDEYLHSAVARSIAEGTFFDVRESFGSFFSYLGPLLMAPAWLIADVHVAYRLSQAAGAIAFALAVFPAYLIARRVGIGQSGAFMVAVLAVLVPGGAFTARLLAEPYAYTLLLLGVAVGVEALSDPTIRRQFAVVGLSVVLPLLGGPQFIVFAAAYALASIAVGPRTPREYLRRNALIVAAAGIAVVTIALALVTGFGRIGGIYALAVQNFDYPPGAAFAWFGVNVFVLAIASGWVIVPGAVVGFADMARSADPRCRAFAFLSLFLIVGQVAQAVPFGVNWDLVLERYAFYASPLLMVAFVWWVESLRGRNAAHVERRKAYVGVAIAGAVAALLLPVRGPLLGAFLDDSPTLLGLSQIPVGERPSEVFVWAPTLVLLALVVAWRGAAVARGLIAVAAVLSVMISLGTSQAYAESAQTRTVPHAQLPHGVALVTWPGVVHADIMEVLFWNRAITRVLVLSTEAEARIGLISSTRARLAPGPTLVAEDGSQLAGPFVIRPDTEVIEPRSTASRQALLEVLAEIPPVIAFGLNRQSGSLSPVLEIHATNASAEPMDLIVGARNEGHRHSAELRCAGGPRGAIEVGTRQATLAIPLQRGVVKVCRFVVSGAIQRVGGVPVVVGAEGELRLAARGR
jgi:hypothetical protein